MKPKIIPTRKEIEITTIVDNSTFQKKKFIGIISVFCETNTVNRTIKNMRNKIFNFISTPDLVCDIKSLHFDY